MTAASSSSYNNATHYIVGVSRNFNLQTYYHNFCDGFNRDQTEKKLIKDIEESIFELGESDESDREFKEWRQEQIDNGFPITKTIDAENFWIFHESDRINTLNKQKYVTTQSRLVTDNSEKTNGNNIQTRQNLSMLKRSECCVIEADSTVKFNNRSLSSLLKSNGKFLFQTFKNLNDNEKALCAYGLCGILDLTNELESGQRSLFTASQWNFLKKEFKSSKIKHLPELSEAVRDVLYTVKKLVEAGNPKKAYYYALSSVENSSPCDEWISKVLYHVLNVYNDRAQIFTASPAEITECDYMAKLWFEVFELMFGTDAQYIKWGESVSKTTTNVKRVNNGNAKHTIGCKVDGRVLCRIGTSDEVLHVCQIEAARSANKVSKNLTDRAKLAIESKCIVDDTVSRPNFKATRTPPQTQNVQLCGVQGQVSSLKLVDKGLYVHVTDYSISMETDILLFARNMTTWFRKLMKFKNTCYLNSIVYSTAANHSTNINMDTAFGHEVEIKLTKNTCNPSWVRGTFFLPAPDKPAIFPENFLTSPLRCESAPYEDMEKLRFNTISLEDGTSVTIKKQKKKDKKLHERVQTDEGHSNKKKGKDLKEKVERAGNKRKTKDGSKKKDKKRRVAK